MTDAAAFFDLDRTLMTGTSASHFARAVCREGVYPLASLLRDGWWMLAFKLVGVSDEGSEAVRDRILASVRGTDADTLQRLSADVAADLVGRIRPEAHALLDMHHEAGRDVWVVSASPVEIVAEVARLLEVTGGLGTQSEIVDGVYTGDLAAPFCYGEGKAERISLLATAHGYDLDRCYAYSDSASDLPMMQLVGHPVAVNPDRGLLALAHRRGWPIVEFNRERKHLAKLLVSGGLAVGAGGGGYALGRRHGLRRALGVQALRRARRALVPSRLG